MHGTPTRHKNAIIAVRLTLLLALFSMAWLLGEPIEGCPAEASLEINRSEDGYRLQRVSTSCAYPAPVSHWYGDAQVQFAKQRPSRS